MRKSLLAAVVVLGSVSVAQAGNTPPITDPVVLKECSACHLAFPPQLLPAASWEKMMGNLANHFGEDATVSKAAQQQILDYHVQNSGDVTNIREGRRTIEGLPAGSMRFTQSPRFISKHNNLDFVKRKAKSKLDCMACHAGADKGNFDD